MQDWTKTQKRPIHTASTIRDRIERGGERLWRIQDFSGLSPLATAQAFSRLAREGKIERLGKGLYYRGRQTTFGKSRPNPAAISKLISKRKAMYPAGLAAANLLGFSTQTPRRAEIATTELSLPRKLLGSDVLIHARRPQAWTSLSETDAALLDFLRRRGTLSELSPKDTARKILDMMAEDGRLYRILKAADSEPPRVRAMLGAIAERLHAPADSIRRLRASLNPYSRFDFGLLASLPNARNWQAKEAR